MSVRSERSPQIEIDIQTVSRLDDDRWDRFLESLERSHHEQTSSWAEVEETRGWSCERATVRKNDRIVSGGQLLSRIVRGGVRVGYVRKGPLFADDDPKLRSAIIRAILRRSKELKLLYLVIDPAWPDESLVRVLAEKGFARNRDTIPPWNMVTATLILDLSKSLDELRMEMRRETRREIRISEEAGLRFSEGTQRDVRAFFELMSRTAGRHGEPPVPDLSTVEALWSTFRPRGWIRMFLVHAGAELVSAALVFPFGSAVRFWKYGWSGHHKRQRPNHFLYWNLVKWAKSAGYRLFDIVQVEPEIARALRQDAEMSESMRRHPLFGPTLFKLGFGGTVVELPGAHYRFSNRVLHKLAGVLAPRLVGIGPLKRMLNRMS